MIVTTKKIRRIEISPLTVAPRTGITLTLQFRAAKGAAEA